MSKKQILITIIAFLISCLLVIIGSNPNTVYAKILGFNQNLNNPVQLYRVYLEGESLGLIKSKQELEDYIDQKQEQLKKKYNANKVYAPHGLDIVKEITYNEKVASVATIYKKIEEIKGTSSFTIDGYKIVIEGVERSDNEDGSYITEDLIIYILDKEIFTNSVKKAITAFVDEETYNAYLNDTQKQLEENEIGSIVESLSIKNNIIIKKERIPTGDKIYQTEEELSKFLLFGTTASSQKYTVKAGDTIEEISYNNRLSTEEFLIANTEIKDATELLYPGQVVNLGLITPQFDLDEVRHVVSKETIKKETVYKNDDTKYVGYETVEEQGQDGLALVTEKIYLTNGEIKNTINVSSVELSPAINKVIVRGTKRYQTSIGAGAEVPVEMGSWVWPTKTPYRITSSFGWRWGKLHEGIDIAGAGYGSPIKAANNGLVVQSGYTNTNGNYIIIAHKNGYYTIYAHMAKRYKSVGNVVMAGDQIGTMGETGFATGVHLHFGVFYGYPFRGGVAKNPLNFY